MRFVFSGKVDFAFFAFFACLSLFYIHPLPAQDKPLSVLIIGGGPAGLAAAIEAKLNGCDVVVVEKRDAYTRARWLILLNNTLRLLKRWDVDTSELSLGYLENEGSVGFLPINDLEECLEKRVRGLGINIIRGEFQGFRDDHAVVILPQKGHITLAYDVIVGADGPSSILRKSLGIENTCLGSAMGAVAIIPSFVESSLTIHSAVKLKNGYIRNVTFPFSNMVFTQFSEKALKDDVWKALEEQGADTHATVVKNDKAILYTSIKIILQQAQSFSDENRSAILIGDAAATASFFQGMGVNTAFMAVEIAGRFFKEIQMQKIDAFQNFNRSIKKVTDQMIEDSSYLFGI